MAFLVAAIECLAAPRIRELDGFTRVEKSWQAATCAAEGPDGRAEILCLGDSLVKLGILPRVLANRLSGTAYNLGVLGGQAPNSYFLLRKVLEKGNHPRALVVDFSENLLAFSPSQNAACWSHLHGWRDSLDVAWHAADPALAISTGLHRLLPGWCDQSQRHRLFAGASRGKTMMQPADAPGVFERNWRFNLGAQVAPRDFVAVEETQSDSRCRWQPNRANSSYVDRLLGMAEARQIPVFWVLTPTIKGHRHRLAQSSSSAAYHRFIAARVARFSCLTVLDGENLGWSIDAFRDPTHVNRVGAVRLSLAVAAAIAPRLRGSRSGPNWVDLIGSPREETGQYQNLVEDLDQSRSAVEPIVVGQNSGEVATW
jgi:hypothetical protein